MTMDLNRFQRQQSDFLNDACFVDETLFCAEVGKNERRNHQLTSLVKKNLTWKFQNHSVTKAGK